MHEVKCVINQTDNAKDSAGNSQLLWFAGALGTTVGIAVWAYSRKELSHWERTKRAARQAADTAAEMKPWLGIGGATAAVGCAALAYRLREPKSRWQRVSKRADDIVSQTGKQLKPWLAVIAGTTLSVASTAYSAKMQRRVRNSVADRAANAAYRVADAGSRIWRRVQTISGETGKLYPRVRQMIA